MLNQVTGENEKTPPELAEALKADGHCVLYVGEVVQIQGGNFRVSSIGPKMMVLQGMPKTHIEELEPLKEMRVAQAELKKALAQREQIARLVIALLIAAGGSTKIDSKSIEDVGPNHRFRVDPDETGMLTLTAITGPDNEIPFDPSVGESTASVMEDGPTNQDLQPQGAD